MKQTIKIVIVLVFCLALINLRVVTTVIEPRLRKANTVSLSTGSSGVRFSGEKVQKFTATNGAKLLSEIRDSAKNFFPSPNSKEEFGKKCDQWAVVTTIHVPNSSIVGVSNLRNWCLVIVGDTITPDESYNDLASKENVFYLSAEYQKKFLRDNLFMKMMPFKSFARKNLGYLFAIQFGARVMYDFDDDNVLMPLEDGVSIPSPLFHVGNDDSSSSNRTVLLKITNSTQQHNSLAFNPLIHMGASHQYSWPRGFPIDDLQKNFLQGNLHTTEVGDLPLSSIGVIQSLCNGDPDTDAIFRMTRPNSTNFTFDRSTKSIPLLVPYRMYTPYNAQATTHLYNAFWGLYLPITVPGRVTDIWRSYITQRIMKDVGLYVIYTPPIVQHERSPHDYLADFNAENDLYLKTSKLLEFLNSWASDATNLPERIYELWVELFERNYIESNDVEAAREWLNSLTIMGYKFPNLVADNNSNKSLVIVMGELRGGEKTWKTLYENVLDPNSADLALIVGEPTKDDQYVNSTLYARSKYLWFFPEYDDWVDAVDLINGPDWRETHLPKMKRFESTGIFGGIKGFKGSGIIVFMIRWFLSRRLQKSNVLQKYDTFVITRADHYYLCPHQFTDLEVGNGIVWTPEGEDYGGVTDRHVVVSKTDILQTLDVLPSFLSKPFEDTIPLDNNNKNKNAEWLLKQSWIRNGLKLQKFPRVMATCAAKTDTTRWRVASQSKNNMVEGEPTLFKKYKNEWVLANKVCTR